MHHTGVQRSLFNPLLTPEQVSLVITTYNWPEALDLVLESVSRQYVMPGEVLIADDGSAEPTARLVASWKSRLPISLKHLWQENRGFRAAQSRNRAIAAARGKYIVLLDGDMVLDEHFIADHIAAAEPGCFVQGGRLNTDAKCASSLLSRDLRRPGPFASGIRRPQHAIRSPWLSRFFSRKARTLARVKSCNQGYWRADLLSVNGFDERMIGWGPEDKECAARLINLGIHRKHLRFAGIAAHLHHPTRAPSGANPLDAILEDTLASKRTRCDLGIDRHLKEFAAEIPQDAVPPW